LEGRAEFGQSQEKQNQRSKANAKFLKEKKKKGTRLEVSKGKTVVRVGKETGGPPEKGARPGTDGSKNSFRKKRVLGQRALSKQKTGSGLVIQERAWNQKKRNKKIPGDYSPAPEKRSRENALGNQPGN